jgi:hypothetical protein
VPKTGGSNVGKFILKKGAVSPATLSTLDQSASGTDVSAEQTFFISDHVQL